MVFDIRVLQENDYDDILVGWWKDWGWDPPPREFLPDDGKCGLIVFDGEIPVCAGFVYITNSKVSWVDWIISNKEYREKPNRKEALSLLIESLTNTCRDTGAKYSYALIKHNGLINLYEGIGYKKGDSYTSEMIKIL